MVSYYLVKMNKKTSVRLSIKTRERLIRYGRKGETFDDVIAKLIAEPEWLPKLESAFTEATEKAEESKKTGIISFAHEANQIALSALKAFIEHVKERSR